MVATGAELCVACHDGHAADMNKPVAHAAVKRGDACLSCHQPHSGRTEALLRRESVSETCFACHDRGNFESKVLHEVATDCGTCHLPHGAEQAGLLVEAQDALCANCHDAAATHLHPYTAPARDPRTDAVLQCSSCHNPHSSEHEQLLTHDKTRDLCVQCHRGPNLQVRGRGTD